MFGIQYITDNGEEYYCTGQYGLQFSCDIGEIQEYVSHENAKKIANNLNKSYDLSNHLGKGKLYIIEVVKIPMQREHIKLKTSKPGYRIDGIIMEVPFSITDQKRQNMVLVFVYLVNYIEVLFSKLKKKHKKLLMLFRKTMKNVIRIFILVQTQYDMKENINHIMINL